jgi:hypothetical protein
MNRPVYALAAMLAVLGSTAMAVGPARCQNSTASSAQSRALCGHTARDYMIAAHVFAHYGAGSEAGANEGNQGVQGSATSDEWGAYRDSCGYDPCRGDVYDVPESETTVKPSHCAGYDAGCMYFGGRAEFGADYGCWIGREQASGITWFGTEPSVDDLGPSYWTLYGGDFDYWTAYRAEEVEYWTLYDGEFDYWTAYRNNVESNELALDFADDWDCPQVCYPTYKEPSLAGFHGLVSPLLEAVGDALSEIESHWRNDIYDDSQLVSEGWKTRPVATPHWIDEYVGKAEKSRCRIEAEYAQAEIEAARMAERSMCTPPEYGPRLPALPSPDHVTYGEEYRSLYDLDAIWEREGQLGDGRLDLRASVPRYQSIRQIFGQIRQFFGELLTSVEEEAAEMWDATDDLSGYLEEASCRAAYAAHLASSRGPLPDDAAQSKNLLESVAGSLRMTGRLLLVWADNLEAEASRVLSARSSSPLSR